MLKINQDFYIFPEDVYGVGNASSHRLSVLREGEIDTYEIRSVKMVVANGKGVSVFTLKGLQDEGLTGFAWLFARDTTLEHGLKLVDDNKPEHYTIAPVVNMPLDEYKGLLERMGVKCKKYLKIKKGGAMEKIA